jgi:epoxyqueuosine reductase QueG
MKDYSCELKSFCLGNGADIVGIGDLSFYDLDENPPIETNIFFMFKFAVCIGIRLNDDIINQISDSPTPNYANHYRDINKKLDQLAEQIRDWILDKGFNGYVIPASKIVNEKNLKGELSHKAIARISGIGWQGKSLLIINPRFGPRFRMANVLTDMPLKADEPIKNRCGSCENCKKNCPAQAIKGSIIKDYEYYKDPYEIVDLQKCYKKLLEFKEKDGIGATVCGICIKVCPWGKGDKK